MLSRCKFKKTIQVIHKILSLCNSDLIQISNFKSVGLLVWEF